jgi:hypothetical protein
MTLVLSQASWRFAVQVGDRLVTRKARPFDPFANKNVLYLGPDALISFGYTGPAYLAGLPTDQWLVETLTGYSYPRDARPGSFRLGPLPSWRPLGLVLQTLSAELDAIFAQEPTRRRTLAMFFELVGTGWQWGRRRRPRPVLFGIAKKQQATTTRLWRASRHFGRQYVFAATPDSNADLLDSEALLDRWRQIRSIDEAELLFVGGIRDVAARSPYVGRDCVSIALPPPRYRTARIRFLALEHTEAAVRSSGRPGAERRIGVAFSPWIVGPGAVWAPSILSGSWTVALGGFDVHLEAPEPPAGSGMLGAVSSVDRPRDPS